MVFCQKPDLSAADIARSSGDTAKSVLQLIGPYVLKAEDRTAHQIMADRQLINQKFVRKGAVEGLISTEVRDVMDAAAQEAVRARDLNAAADKSFWGRVKNKFKMSARTLRICMVVLGAVVGAFLIWDLCTHWDDLTPAGQALSVIQIVIEFGIVAIGILEILLPATAWIPVVGQILFIAATVFAICILIWGTPKPQPSATEEFVKRMKDGWVKNLDDPPSPLLEYSINLPAGTSPDLSIEIVAKNKTGSDVKLISPTIDLSHGSPSPDSIASIVLNFSAGTDDPSLFTDAAFWLDGATPAKEKVPGAGKCGSDRSEACYVKKILTPNGTNARNREYQFRIEFQKLPTAMVESVLKAREGFKMTMKGKIGKEGTTTLKIVEARPGALTCIVVFTVKRDKNNGTYSLGLEESDV